MQSGSSGAEGTCVGEAGVISSWDGTGNSSAGDFHDQSRGIASSSPSGCPLGGPYRDLLESHVSPYGGAAWNAAHQLRYCDRSEPARGDIRRQSEDLRYHNVITRVRWIGRSGALLRIEVPFGWCAFSVQHTTTLVVVLFVSGVIDGP